MIPLRITELNEQHLLALIEEGRREDRTIEYKQGWPGKDADNRAPIVEAITSFANEIGGDLVIGMRADSGVPVDVCGVLADDPDRMCLQLDQIVRAQTDPMCSTHTVVPVALSNGRHAFVVRVAQSWARPHRVKINDRFVGRGSAGKYTMDTAQIRTAFLQLVEVPERARALRDARFEMVRRRVLPFGLADGILQVLHLMPMRTFVTSTLLSSRALYDRRDDFRPIVGVGLSTRHNLDGIHNFCGTEPHGAVVQVLRGGVVEVIQIYGQRDEQKRLLFPLAAQERYIVEAAPQYLKGLEALGLPGPYFAFLSYHFPGGAYVPTKYGAHDELAIDREIVLIPEVEIEGSQSDVASAMQPSFDILWNAWGQARSKNYDAHGAWRPVT